MTKYTSGWFQSFKNASGQSANCIVPLLIELAKPAGVIDFGCGLGVWLSEFERLGIKDLRGVDGSYVDTSQLLIDESNFTPHDLTQAVKLNRRYDLALCLEVAEHLPSVSADGLVRSLTQAANIVYFSAAIPHQGGTGHINEQWPEYWAQKFADRGFHAVDAIRRKIWNEVGVDYWYAQNGIVYANETALENNAALAAERDRTDPNQLSMVHPKLHLQTTGRLRDTFDQRLRAGLRVAPRIGRRLFRGASL